MGKLCAGSVTEFPKSLHNLLEIACLTVINGNRKQIREHNDSVNNFTSKPLIPFKTVPLQTAKF